MNEIHDGDSTASHLSVVAGDHFTVGVDRGRRMTSEPPIRRRRRRLRRDQPPAIAARTVSYTGSTVTVRSSSGQESLALQVARSALGA